MGLAHSRASMKPINNDESLINCCHISAMTQSQRCESLEGERGKGEATVTSVKIEIDVVAGAGTGAAVSLQLGHRCCL